MNKVFIGGIGAVIGDPEKKANDLIKLFKSKKYTITKGAVSNTQAGKSVYFYVDYKKKYDNLNLGRGLKVRVSDHGVTNTSRIKNEFHFNTTENKHRKLLDEMTIKQIDNLLSK